MKIAILSDTHNLLRPQVLEHLKEADAILHAGDICSPDILDQLEEYGPLYAVRGNNDWDWSFRIPRSLTCTLGGLSFFLVHNKRDVPAVLPKVNFVVYGHSHRYTLENRNGILWFNPGSCGPCRFHSEVTMAMLEADDGKFHIEKVLISPDQP